MCVIQPSRPEPGCRGMSAVEWEGYERSMFMISAFCEKCPVLLVAALAGGDDQS